MGAVGDQGQGGRARFRRALYAGDTSLLEVAAEALGTLGDEHSVPALTRALGQRNLAVQVKAARSLGQPKDQNAVPALVAALRDFQEEVHREAAVSLGELGGEEAVNGLVSALNHYDVMLVWPNRRSGSSMTPGRCPVC